MNYLTKNRHATFEIKKDTDGWIIFKRTRPYFSLRYFEPEDMFQLTLIAFGKMPKGFQYEVSKATVLLKKAIANANKQLHRIQSVQSQSGVQECGSETSLAQAATLA